MTLPAPSAQAEAARYALLRRLAPSMRHHLVVNLQPIGMIYEVLDRRLRAAEPNLAEVHESAQKINGFAKAALGSSLDMVTWLAPSNDASITAEEGVAECLGLIGTSFTFRGYALRNEVPPIDGLVQRSAVRNVFTGALFHVSDANEVPSDIHLSGESSAQGLVLTLTVRPGQEGQGFEAAPIYRIISWDDLQALAGADGVGLVGSSATTLRLTFPWLPSKTSKVA